MEEEDDEEEDDGEDEGEGGFITLCTEGCGMYSVLVINSEDPETYGTVWFWDFANDFGTAPMKDAQTGRPFHFLDWLEYWADRTAALRMMNTLVLQILCKYQNHRIHLDSMREKTGMW